MRRFVIMLVAKKVFRWVCLSFLVTGHTHSGLDVTFGQLAVKLSLHEFSTDMEVVDLLDGFVRELGVDAASQAAAKCYKLDEVAPGASGPRTRGSTSTTSRGPMRRTTSAPG